MRGRIIRGALFLCLLAFAGTALDPFPSPRLFARYVVILSGCIVCAYGLVAGSVIFRSALLLGTLALVSTTLSPFPSPRLVTETVVFLFRFFCFVYGFAAACERTIALGRFQYRGWTAVGVGLGIAASGLALACLVALLQAPDREGPPRRRATLPIHCVRTAAPQPT